MKRRDFLKGILATPAILPVISKAKNDLDVLKVPSFSPKPSEVEKSDYCEEQLPEYISGTISCSVSPSVTVSCSPSASCEDNPYDIDDGFVRLKLQ